MTENPGDFIERDGAMRDSPRNSQKLMNNHRNSPHGSLESLWGSQRIDRTQPSPPPKKSNIMQHYQQCGIVCVRAHGLGDRTAWKPALGPKLPISKCGELTESCSTTYTQNI